MQNLGTLEHAFTIEMESKQYVKNISISNEAHDRVLFEGNLGELLVISIVEGDVLELVGVNGVLRIALTKEQLRKALRAASESSPSSEGGALQVPKPRKRENKGGKKE